MLELVHPSSILGKSIMVCLAALSRIELVKQHPVALASGVVVRDQSLEPVYWS